MSFTLRPAKREQTHTLIGLAGGTGSGKTFSALRLATGLAGGQRFALIDTEAGRALHYADQFDFEHGDLRPPFTPQAYADAIKACERAGFGVIVVDSASHEHAGDGGLLDWHERELDRMAGDDWKRREAMTFSAWVAPKQGHKRFVSGLLQLRAHLILCFRAEEKIEIVKEGGKTVVRPKASLTGADGWIPVAEKSLPYELTASFLMTADKPGLPKPIKLPGMFAPFFPLDQQIGEDAGKRLAEWAAGGGSGIERLTARLLELLADLGADDRVPVVAAKRDEQTAEAHRVWLERQIVLAEGQLERRGETGADTALAGGARGESASAIESAPTGAGGDQETGPAPFEPAGSTPGDDEQSSIFGEMADRAQRARAETAAATTAGEENVA